jgi:hypothetical protein
MLAALMGEVTDVGSFPLPHEDANSAPSRTTIDVVVTPAVVLAAEIMRFTPAILAIDRWQR